MPTKKPERRKPRTRKSSDANSGTAKAAVAVMVSPLNGAICPTGAHAGNTGGKPGRSGRTPSAVRQACLEAFDARIPRLVQIADGAVALTGECPKCGHQASGPLLPVTEVSDIRNAIDQLGKYGLGERSELSMDVVAANLDKTLSAAETLMEKRDFERFAQLADEIWNSKNG